MAVAVDSGSADLAERTTRAGKTIQEQHSIIGSGHVDTVNDGPKVQNAGKSLAGVLSGPTPPASVRECCSGHSWALGTSLESIAVDTAAISINFASFRVAARQNALTQLL